MWKHKDPDHNPRWLDATFAVTGIVFVLTVLLNFWNAVVAVLE